MSQCGVIFERFGVGQLLVACQQELASESTQCKHIFANNSGHMINVEQPEIIVQAIHELVKEYETKN